MIQETTQLREFRPFPAYTMREAWDSLDRKIREFCLSEAEKLKKTDWLPLTASLYMDFYHSGNRRRYEERYFYRRRSLIVLMLAECIAGGGEYLDQIIDGVWLIAEESTWTVPAHLHHLSPAKELPWPNDAIYIDLFAAETASLFAWVYYFLGDAIAARAPAVLRRMEWELERRIFNPFLRHDDFNWMGLAGDKPVNNWNPWINSNLLVAFLVFTKTCPRCQEGVNKTIRSINRFIEGYAEDGGCDEGPHYYNKAGASLLDFIEELENVADVSYLYRMPKIQNMAAYIYKVHIAGNYFVNYADAPPETIVPVMLLDRVAKKTGDARLAAFSAWMRKNGNSGGFIVERTFSIYRILADMFTPPAPPPAGKMAVPDHPTVSWFPGIQVVCAGNGGGGAAAETAVESAGLFFSAKGGHNDENHNHNDVGNFLLYCGGMPVLVDAGVETYTKFTFNEQRYSLWAMQSCYHNTPTINGADQLPGREYSASDAAFSEEAGVVRFSLDIAGAYPAAAEIQRYRREFVFRQDRELAVTDSYVLGKCISPPVLNLLCRDEPAAAENGLLLSGKVRLDYDAAALDRTIEVIPLNDPKMSADWKKDKLYRLRLTVKDKGASGEIQLRFSIQDKF